MPSLICMQEIIRLIEQRVAVLSGSENERARRQLLEVEGSILLHMDMAAKHDAELGQVCKLHLKFSHTDEKWRCQ